MFLPLIVSVAIAFAVVLLVTPSISGFLRSTGLLGIDQNKTAKPRLPTSGGTAAAVGIFSGLLAFVALATFVFPAEPLVVTSILAALVAIETITVVGFLDDLNVGKVARPDSSGTVEFRKGLAQWKKALFLLPAAIPLMVINAGQPTLLGFQVGLLYPLFFIPVGVVCVASATNMLAGLNGLESGMSAVALAGIGAFALNVYSTTGYAGSLAAGIIALTGAAALAAFLFFNMWPARILPGDSLTHLVGALIASSVIIGNIEKFGVVVFSPWIVEAFVKARRKFKATSLGKIVSGGYLKPKNDRVESLTHAVMRLGNFSERQVVLVFVGIETLIVLAAFFLPY